MTINKSQPELKGKYFELNEAGTEFSFPPATEYVSQWIESCEDLSLTNCNSQGCSSRVRVTEEGNRDYAWYFLTNSSDRYARVTIERRWLYEGRWRSDTVRHRLYPGEHKEVFSFPRNQSPRCCILSCSLE